MDPKQGTFWILNGFKLAKKITNVNLGVLTEETVGQNDRKLSTISL